MVPLEALETVTGLKFFPEGLQEPGRRRALDHAARKWQEAGRAQLKVWAQHPAPCAGWTSPLQ